MRDDYRVVRRFWAEVEGWSEADLAEVDAGIKADVAGGDAKLIGCWADWLAGLAGEIRANVARMRAMEEQMRKQARQDREAKERKAA